MDEFQKLLPIDDNKYSQLTSRDGLNGYRLQGAMSGNVILAKDGINVLSLSGDSKSEIMPELNALKKKKRFGFFGGNRKSKKSKKSKTKKSKTRKNRRKSNRRR